MSSAMPMPPVNQQMDAIRHGAAEIVPEDDLVRKIEESLKSGSRLRIKQGFDPTRPDLHIGHAVSIRKLRTFQELGHEVIFVVGDYTARVGDPTGRSETRPRLTPAEIAANAQTYEEQVSRIVDVTKVRVAYNSEWLAPLDLARLLELTATYTVARMLERDDFSKRYADGRPISLLEFMYPLLQAYDSVALNADVELGGSDQKFNLLVGRTVQERYGQSPQVCLIMPLLRGTDGEQKMSKSSGNYIGIAESAEEQFGKTMSIPDTLLEEWYVLTSGLEGAELDAALERCAAEPYRTKRALGRLIAAQYHGADAAARAEEHFDRVFREHALPEEVPEVLISLEDARIKYDPVGGARLTGLLVASGLASSNTEAIRFIEQGAITVDEQRVGDRNAHVPLKSGDAVVLKRGKRHFARVKVG
jgi:tyrosyl-tRNA synthetase